MREAAEVAGASRGARRTDRTARRGVDIRWRGRRIAGLAIIRRVIAASGRKQHDHRGVNDSIDDHANVSHWGGWQICITPIFASDVLVVRQATTCGAETGRFRVFRLAEVRDTAAALSLPETIRPWSALGVVSDE